MPSTDGHPLLTSSTLCWSMVGLTTPHPSPLASPLTSSSFPSPHPSPLAPCLTTTPCLAPPFPLTMPLLNTSPCLPTTLSMLCGGISYITAWFNREVEELSPGLSVNYPGPTLCNVELTGHVLRRSVEVHEKFQRLFLDHLGPKTLSLVPILKK